MSHASDEALQYGQTRRRPTLAELADADPGIRAGREGFEEVVTTARSAKNISPVRTVTWPSSGTRAGPPACPRALMINEALDGTAAQG